MKNEEIYHNLKEISEKVGIEVTEKNLQIPGLRAKSGLCTVEGKKMFIMDKRKTIKEKVDILGDCICQLEIDEIYIIPKMREILDKYKSKYIKDDEDYYSLF